MKNWIHLFLTQPKSPRTLKPIRHTSSFFYAALLSLILIALDATASHLSAAADISATTSFTAADGSRDYMDRGGVWNGSSETSATTGDTFSVTLTNNGDTAFDFALSVALPSGFSFVPGSATVTGATPASAPSQSGTTLDFNLPTGFDLASSASITATYTLVADASNPSGTYAITPTWTYADTDGGATNAPETVSQSILLQAGAAVINVTPDNPVLGLGESSTFTITVTNTGLGGLFDVLIDHTAIDANASLTRLSLAQTAPALAADASVAGELTLPYLAPGESFTATSEVRVDACDSLAFDIATADRNAETNTSVTTPITLDFDQPLVAFTAPSITLDYGAPVSASIVFSNTGVGDAFNFSLETDFETLPVTISNLAAGWSYAAGVFTLDSGTIAMSNSATLTFDIAATDVCDASGAGSVIYQADYENECGDTYGVPLLVGSVSAASNTPTVSLDKTVSSSRLAVTESGSYTLTLSGSNRAQITDTSLVITDTLPADITASTLTASHGSAVRSGNVITWTVPTDNLPDTPTLGIAFTVDSDPCLGGESRTNTASLTATTTAGCTLMANTDATFLITNNPGSSATQFFEVGAPSGGFFETGNSSADGTQDAGEGDFLSFVADYSFSAGYPGNWRDGGNSATFTDNFGGLSNQTLVPGSLEISINAGAATAVPVGSITDSGPGRLEIDLGFVADTTGDSVANSSIQITYQTTTSDADLGGATTRDVTQITTLSILDGTGGTGVCEEGAETRFRQGVLYSIGRADTDISLSLPSQMSICVPATATLTLDNANSKNVSNLLATVLFDGSDYDYLGSPTFSGVFNSGNITVATDGDGNPTFEYTGGELTGSGSIDFSIQRSANSGTTASALSARAAFDDNETNAAASRAFTRTASDSPILVRTAELAILVAPDQRLPITGDTTQWTIYVTNLGSGVAPGASLVNELPSGLTLNTALTDAANAGLGLSVTSSNAGQTATWDLGTLAAASATQITLVADVSSTVNCSIPDGSNTITATWGCSATLAQTTAKAAPNFSFPTGNLLVVHDSTNSFAEICDTGEVIIRVKNTGAARLDDITVFEALNPATTGIDIVGGSVTYREDGGAWIAGGDPSGAGTTASPYSWTSTEIPTLASLVPTGGSGVELLEIRFDISASELANDSSGNILASATAALFCGNPLSSPGTTFAVPVRAPDITVQYDAQNTTDATAFSDVTVSDTSDSISWRVRITNNGDAPAKNVRLQAALSGTAGASSTLVPPSGGSSAYTSDSVVSIADIPAGATVTYLINETIGTDCQNVTAAASVTWGCVDNGATTASGLSSPSDNSDTTRLTMSPEFTSNGGEYSQSFTALADGRGRIDLTLRNAGATASSIVITDTLPASLAIDTSVSPTLESNTSSLSAVILNAADLNAPIFSGVGTIAIDESVTLRFYVVPDATVLDSATATTFPDLAAVETTSGSLDPTLVGAVTNSIELAYQNPCGDALSEDSDSSINPLQPDIDIELSTDTQNRIVSAGVSETFDIVLTNNGESGSSATDIAAALEIGPGWTVSSVALTATGASGTGGNATFNGGSGQWEFTAAQVGTLASGSDANIRIQATPTGAAGDSLSIETNVTGTVIGQDDATAFGTHSTDRRTARVVGIELSKTLTSTSETESAGSTLLVGEEATFQVSARFFGTDGSSLSNIAIRENLGDSSPAHTSIGYVSQSLDAANELTVNTIAFQPGAAVTPPPVLNARFSFNLADTDLSGGNDTFVGNITARALNDDLADGFVLNTNLGLSFDYNGATFHSNDADDSFSGGNATSLLHAELPFTLALPGLTIDKQSRNITRDPGSAFDTATTGQAGDVFEFRVVVTNPGTASAPLFDIQITDTLDAKLSLLDGASSPSFALGADTTADASPDVLATSGVTAGSGGSFTLTSAALPIPTLGQNLDRLDPGESITLYYRAAALFTVTPSEQLENTVTATGDTLTGPSGNQTSGLQASNDAEDGPDTYTASDTLSLTVDPIQQSKLIETTSVGADTSTNVLVGEQIRFRISIVIPQGSVSDFIVSDSLPAGLSLLQTPTPSVGSAITPAGSLSITPGTLPADGDPLAIQWDFGDLAIAAGSEADRTVTLTYLTQVRNTTDALQNTTLQNSASYSFNGSPTNITSQTLTVKEAALSVVKTVSPDANLDAGDTLTYSVTITNTGDVATAYDLRLVDTLPAGLTYTANSVSVDTGATTGLSGTLGEPDLSGQTLTWGETQSTPLDLDLAAGGVLAFSYAVTLDDSVEPNAVLNNDLEARWSSLDGDGPDLGVALGAASDIDGERDGSFLAVNQYLGEDQASATVANTSTLTKSASGQTLPLSAPATAYRVGDLVTYTLELTLQEGTHENLQILDTLPAGMSFAATQSITPASGDAAFTYTTPAGANAPAADATGAIAWVFPSIVNTGDNDSGNNTLTLVYTARLRDDSSVLALATSTQSYTNSARLSFDDASDTPQTTTPQTASITVEQPNLSLAKSRTAPASSNQVAAGEDASFRLTVLNSGPAPAYNPEISDTLPLGARSATPQLIAATLDSADVSANLTTSYDPATGLLTYTLDDATPVLPSQTLLIDYRITLDAAVDTSLTLTNAAQVASYYSKPANDPDHRRQYGPSASSAQSLDPLLVIAGTLFEDRDQDGIIDSGENWSDGTTLFVNLVSSGTIQATATVSPGSGTYRFEDVASGNYQLIVTTSATATLPSTPTPWQFTSPSSGQRSLTVGTLSQFDLTFGLARGGSVSGTLFTDNGGSSGTANNGIQDGDETGRANITVQLTDCAGTVFGSAVTDTSGNYTLAIPPSVADGAQLCIEPLYPANTRPTGGNPGDTGGSYSATENRVSFLYAENSSTSGVALGLIDRNRFLTDGQLSILPGNTAFHPHKFISGTRGTLSFTASIEQQPEAPAWGQTFHRDLNCNGELDDGEPQITGPIATLAGEEICIINKVIAPSGATPDANHFTTITATFAFEGSLLADEESTRNDATLIGLPDGAGLILNKEASTASARPGDSITYTITYSNNSSEALDEIVIRDATPAFTTFASATTSALPDNLASVTQTAPAIGETGELIWTFTGTLAPGQSGSVSYTVTVE